MKLELNILRIKDVKFANQTTIKNGVLSLNVEELKQYLGSDKRLSNINLALAHPGESCRIVRVIDIIEPRAKIGKSGQEYPGAIDKLGTVGRGKTCVLRGCGLVINEFIPNIDIRFGDPIGEFIDMSGPGAEIGAYGNMHHIVLMASPADGVRKVDYNVALKIAGLKASTYLAQAGVNLKPDEIEVYELHTEDVAPDLPRVVYIFQVLTTQYVPLEGDPVFYGENIGGIVPTIVHPNEVLDGAITSPYSTMHVETYNIQNHPIINKLYAEHGKNLSFGGVIITNAPNNVPEYERSAAVAANLAKWVLKADGAILTKTGGGAPELTMARTAQRCEQMGIKTALAFVHMGIDASDANIKANVIFDAPEVDAMVSMGAPPISGSIALPVPQKVIGVPEGLQITSGGSKQLRQIKGTFSQMGNSKMTAERY